MTARSLVSTAWVVLVVLASGCSSGNGAARSSTTSLAGAAARGVVCNGANEVNQDDDGALSALLQRSQLPGGAWTTATTPPCPSALSTDELLRVPECRAAAASANAPANSEHRNGNGRITFPARRHAAR